MIRVRAGSARISGGEEGAHGTDRALWLVAMPLSLVLLAVGGTWVYFNVISDDAPARLTFEGRDEQTGVMGDGGEAVEAGAITGHLAPDAGQPGRVPSR